jgi:hypothetical protein
MERLAKQLKLEKEELERLKAEVNGMEHDLMQRRLRRVSCTTAIPTVSDLLGCIDRNVRTLAVQVVCFSVRFYSWQFWFFFFFLLMDAGLLPSVVLVKIM